MKEKMKERKERKKSKKALEELEAQLKNVQPGSAEEAEIREALRQREEADRLRETEILLAALAEVDTEQEEKQRRQV